MFLYIQYPIARTETTGHITQNKNVDVLCFEFMLQLAINGGDIGTNSKQDVR